MSKKIKRFIAVIAIATMILGTGVVSNASVDEHECSYSLVECKDQGITTVATHQYVTKIENGKEIMAICTVSYHAFLDIYRCGCGAQKTSPHGFSIHSSCGQH